MNAEPAPTQARVPARHVDLKVVWALSFGSLALGFPFYSYLVFELGHDRGATADLFSIHATIAYWVGMGAALLPLPSLASWSRFQRLQTACLTFMIASYATHLTWELGWVLLHEEIATARNDMWAYAWWAYIDGGDLRYLRAEPSFVMMEMLSVTNGCVGLTGLVLLWRSEMKSILGVLLCMSTAVTHTILTWYYYGTEALTGFASVDTDSTVDLWFKFVLLNGPWLVFPWLVLVWGHRILTRLVTERAPD